MGSFRFKTNWEVRLDLSVHKFAKHQSYYLIIEVLFTIMTHNIYHMKLYSIEYITYITYFLNWTKFMKQTLRKCWAARLRNYNINYTNLIFDGVLDEVLDGRVNVP